LRHFIIGYGSLLKLDSLQRTLPYINDIDIIYLNNFSRSWNACAAESISYTTTFLGIEKSPNDRINCIIFEINKDSLSILDQRESLYKRIQINFNDIEFISNSKQINIYDNIWIYETITPVQPSRKFPIIQSYVDTCLSGALEIEKKFSLENFSQEFIKTTKQWSEYWINDRIYPRVPHIHQPDAYIIDYLLNKHIYYFYKKITLE